MRKIWWLAGFIVLGVLLSAGVLLLVTRPPRGEPIRLLPAPTPAPLLVYVTGKVKQEGLYSLPIGSRMNDAIRAAGGFSENANTQAINLAELLEDGEQVYVPPIMPTSQIGDDTRLVPEINILVDINTATLDQLDTLPEIGPITAQKILDYRNKNGSFKKIEDLLKVDGIGQVTFDRIKDLITVGTSP
ncbi:MAG TPA: helix-hairpin-helix domain-containing protein [Anaerolineales bacterium]|nr:helix-hairpin-helix domain-containing protein [Anaerolineales bacterium]